MLVARQARIGLDLSPSGYRPLEGHTGPQVSRCQSRTLLEIRTIDQGRFEPP